MPALTKHVRFSSINALYSPIPSTPYVFTSTATSTSSSSTSSERSNHSKRRRHVSKLTTHPRLALAGPEPIVRIHYMLAFSPYQQPSLSYDLCVHPSLVSTYIAPDILSEAATDPPVQSLIVTCPHLHWEFPVRPTPSKSRQDSYVSVHDVLNELYRGLRATVHPLEYEALPSMEAVTNVNEAYYSRCNSIMETKARLEEQAKGVKRIDFLMGRNRFLGLSKKSSRKAQGDSLVWELKVS